MDSHFLYKRSAVFLLVKTDQCEQTDRADVGAFGEMQATTGVWIRISAGGNREDK
jgi:hypothetical protein